MMRTMNRAGLASAVPASALLLAVGLLGAPEAQARDEFEKGFKSELGRIAAHEAVSLGFGVLGEIFQPVYGGHRRYSPPPRRHRHYRHRYYRGGYGDDPYVRYRPRRAYRHRHHGGPHTRACGYERHERYERDDYGGYERYERYERAVPRW